MRKNNMRKVKQFHVNIVFKVRVTTTTMEIK